MSKLHLCIVIQGLYKSAFQIEIITTFSCQDKQTSYLLLFDYNFR